MKNIYALILLVLTTATVAFGQSTKVTTGVINVQQGDYEEGVKNLKIGMSDLSQLNAKLIPKGFYYLGKGYMGILMTAQRDKNAELIAKYPNAMLDAYEAYANAKKHDDGKWGDKVDAELMRMYPMFLGSGNEMVSMAYKQKGDAQKEVLGEAMKYLNAAAEMRPESYVVQDLLGQSMVMKGDTAGAMTAFEKSIKLFGSNPPAQPDLFIGYTFYRVSLLARQKDKDLDKALSFLSQGQKALDGEWKKVKEKKADYSAEDYAKAEEQYNNGSKDIQSFELDIYLVSPDKLQEALAKFEKAAKEEPDNYVIHVAYASLLEKIDPAKAVEFYKKAIAIKPEEEHAYFNLGALYNNMAKEKFDQANAEKDYEKAAVFQKEGDEVFKLALPNFEKCYQLNPKNLTVIRALKQITIRLEMMDDYNKYKEAEAKLTGG
ncbi:MAG: hypothetical protein H6581_01280 [Bacteroidia bacterium]|nr:hypothetical protein [Bacteroidia bacterium]